MFLLVVLCYVVLCCIVQYPPLCDEEAAIACEFEFLQCRLFSGPADDPDTMCACGESFYGDCIRRAGCVMNTEFDKLGNNEVFLKKCVDHVVKYDCPSTLMCAVNCASEGSVNASSSQVMPINNYGDTHLRLRICEQKLHENKLKKYSTVVSLACNDMSEFLVCERWIPPFTFVVVALPTSTTYLEIDYCDVSDDETERHCRTVDPAPARLYGSSVLFPSTFDVAQTNVSICSTDGNTCDVTT
jgi:hypothetical protein